jgi:hypothetical protein
VSEPSTPTELSTNIARPVSVDLERISFYAGLGRKP